MIEKAYGVKDGDPAAVNFLTLKGYVDFIGNENTALIVGALLSLLVLARQRKPGSKGIADLIGPPLETGGVIILITTAGGAFRLHAHPGRRRRRAGALG